MNACPQFSIIIPCYNVGQWIRTTIESVLAQTCDDFEIIAVDDGSQDDTLIQLESINDPRIIILNKENGGVSSARNMGLRQAKGQWVTFIDADDTVESCMLEELQKAITRSPESSLFIWGISKDFYHPDGRLVETETRLPSQDLYIPNKELGSHLRYMLMSLDMESSCNKLFRREAIENCEVLFDEKTVIFEDFQFVIDYLAKAMPDVSLLKKSWYHYRTNVGELNVSRRSRHNLVTDISTLILKLFALKDMLSIPVSDEQKINSYIIQKLNVIFAALKNKPYSFKIETLTELKKSNLFQFVRMFPLCGRKVNIILKLTKLSPLLGALIIK